MHTTPDGCSVDRPERGQDGFRTQSSKWSNMIHRMQRKGIFGVHGYCCLLKFKPSSATFAPCLLFHANDDGQIISSTVDGNYAVQMEVQDSRGAFQKLRKHRLMPMICIV